MYYEKRPRKYEVWQWQNAEGIFPEWLHSFLCQCRIVENDPSGSVVRATLPSDKSDTSDCDGYVTIRPGDWILRDTETGDITLRKDSIFTATYDPVPEKT